MPLYKMSIEVNFGETQDIEERARRVDNALRDGSVRGILDSYKLVHHSVNYGPKADMVRELTCKMISSSAKLTIFFKAFTY